VSEPVSERAENAPPGTEARVILSLTVDHLEALLGWWSVVYGEGMNTPGDDYLMSVLEAERARSKDLSATPYTRITEAANS
jgi:hypothetical protein